MVLIYLEIIAEAVVMFGTIKSDVIVLIDSTISYSSEKIIGTR